MSDALKLKELCRLPLSAASGLIADEDGIWVVADNLSGLHRYSLAGVPQKILALDVKGDALEPTPKKHKLDLEALARLPDGRLLALGSGSKPHRVRGFIANPATGHVQPLDLTNLYGELNTRFERLNIEGAVVQRDSLVLAQRGNNKEGVSALILLDLPTVLAGAASGELLAAALRAVRPIALGKLRGAPLSFTDLAVNARGQLHFSAAAERTDDPYEDAPCAGSVIGGLGSGAEPSWMLTVGEDRLKVEGLHLLRSTDKADHWLLVADADDPEVPAPLLEVVTARA